MSKDENIVEVEGRVKEILPGGKFLVALITEGFEEMKLTCQVSGKMRMYSIKIVPGDRVTIEISPHNLEFGRITYRHRK